MLVRHLILLFTTLVPAVSYATVITNFAVGEPISIGTTANGSYDSQAFSSPITLPRTISLDVTLESGYVNNTPFSYTFATSDTDGSATFDGASQYLVTVNMTNNRVHPISPVTFTLSDLSFRNDPAENPEVVGPVPFRFAPGIGSSNYNTVNFNGVLAGVRTLQFGGFNGGGGELYTGQTGTFTFAIDLPDMTSSFGLTSAEFTLSMVANPEPASLALAGFAMSSAGAGYISRRRKKKIATSVISDKPPTT